MSEQSQQFEEFYIPEPEDWQASVVLQPKREALPVSDGEALAIQHFVGQQAMRNTLHGLAVEVDVTDTLTIAFYAAGHDKEDAITNSMHAMLGGLSVIQHRFGAYRLLNMQLGQVREMAVEDRPLLHEAYDVTQEAREELELITELNRDLASI